MPKFQLLVFFFFGIIELNAQSSTNQLLQSSLQANERIAAKISELEKLRYDRKEITADNLVKVEYAHERLESEFHNITNDQIIPRTSINRDSITAKQEIFNPNAYPLYKINNQTKLLIENEVNQLISQTLLDTMTALIELQIIKSEEKTLNNNLTLTKELLKITKIKREVGQSSELDLLNAKQNLLNNKTELIKNKRNLLNQTALLIRLTNISEFPEYELDEKLSKYTISSLAELITEARQSNQSLQIKDSEITIQKTNKLLAKSNFLPSANIYYSYNITDGGYSFINQNYTEESEERYGVNISVPLFASGKNIYKIKGINSVISKKTAEYQDQKDRVTENITSLYNDIRLLEEVIIQNKQANQIAKLSLNAAKSEYITGKLDFTDLLAAQNILLNSENNLIQSQLNQQKQYYKLIYLLGKLTPEFFDFNFYLK